jgi:signal peptidase I
MRESKYEMKKKIVIALLIAILLGGAILLGTFTYGFRVMTLQAGSMANTVLTGEKVATTRFFSSIKRGDLVVFKYPLNPNILYLKRVIGLPGETIEVRGMKVIINDHELPEKRVKVDIAASDPQAKTLMQELGEEGSGEYRVFYDTQNWEGKSFAYGMKYATNMPFKIPPGQYFMMGDSRDNSMDSRFWGTVSQDAIVGIAYMIVSSDVPERDFLELK